MVVLGVDPGPVQSAYVLWDGERILDKAIVPNERLVSTLEAIAATDTHLFVEMIGHYGTGMPAGKTVFLTCVWIGRFIERWGRAHTLILRPTVKTHLCGSAKAKDQHVRQALIDRLGAPGTKRNQGRTYGVSKDIWSALAVSVCAYDRLLVGIGGDPAL